jgi:predicted metalloprotease
MGEPVTCEFADPNGTGDVHQETSKGLAFWRKSTNTPTFTDGNQHWAITAQGLVSWIGTSIDPPGALPADQRLRSLAQNVSEDVNAFWARQVRGYTPARVSWFRGLTPTACGPVRTGDGPLHCALDDTVYLDTAFMEELWGQGLEFGVATVIAHEIGHHVQQQVGLVRPRLSIQTELGADCLAGVWSKDANRRGELDRADIVQALSTSWVGGDPASVPWYAPGAHGSPTDRVQAWATGYNDASLSECLGI